MKNEKFKSFFAAFLQYMILDHTEMY